VHYAPRGFWGGTDRLELGVYLLGLLHLDLRAPSAKCAPHAHGPRTSPQSAMMTSTWGLSPAAFATFSMALTTSIPSTTFPKTTWRPSSHEVTTVVMKNCEPFVSLPAFAMLRKPGAVCLSLKFSSANLSP
jgi:hypothetical protein